MVRAKLDNRFGYLISQGITLESALAPHHVFPSLPIPRLQATVEEQLEEIKQELEGTKEKIEDQEFAMEVDQEEITRLKDRDRKRAKLLADNAEAKRMAVEKVRDAEKEKWEAKLNEHITSTRRSLRVRSPNACRRLLASTRTCLRSNARASTWRTRRSERRGQKRRRPIGR